MGHWTGNITKLHKHHLSGIGLKDLVLLLKLQLLNQNSSVQSFREIFKILIKNG